MNNFQDQLDRAFPVSSDASVIRGITEGILLADNLMQGDSLLSGLLGGDLRGHIRRLGILHRIYEMVQIGDLPFAASVGKMPRGGWHWVEITSKSIKAHVYRTDGPTLFPVDSPTRQDDRYSNQPDFFESLGLGDDIAFRCAWLMFGVTDKGTLSHLCWGMPSAKTDEWLARTNIMRRAQQNAVEIRVEVPTPKIKLQFREHVEEALVAKNNKNRAA